jgi:hypothetical protein
LPTASEYTKQLYDQVRWLFEYSVIWMLLDSRQGAEIGTSQKWDRKIERREWATRGEHQGYDKGSRSFEGEYFVCGILVQ